MTIKFSTILKRWADIFVSAVAIVLLLPLFVLLCIVISLDSLGSPFFLQVRVGRYGQCFQMLKFRSMFIDADKRLDDPDMAIKAEAEGRVLKLKNDPRVTRIGNLLRTSSLDELPQLINVLLGQMSLVGPPCAYADMVDPYPDLSERRHTVRPGITGFWQVSAREHNESLADMIEDDLHYIQRWSLFLDAIIIARTPGAVISRKGAV